MGDYSHKGLQNINVTYVCFDSWFDSYPSRKLYTLKNTLWYFDSKHDNYPQAYFIFLRKHHLLYYFIPEAENVENLSSSKKKNNSNGWIEFQTRHLVDGRKQ